MQELERKLLATQEVASRATEEANRARVEAGVKAREFEGLNK